MAENKYLKDSCKYMAEVIKNYLIKHENPEFEKITDLFSSNCPSPNYHFNKPELKTFLSLIENTNCPNPNYYFKEAEEKLDTEAFTLLFEILSGDDEWRLRLLVAENRRTPDSILKKLEKDENKYVKHAAVTNPKRVEETLRNIFRG